MMRRHKMITYEYECSQCGRFDYKQSIKDDALKTCPHCGDECMRGIPRHPLALGPGPAGGARWKGYPHLKEVGLLD